MSDIRKALNETVVFVLEDWALMMVEEVPDGFKFPAAGVRSATAQFSGPFKGKLNLRCSDEFLLIAARNLLGLEAEDDVSEESTLDLLREFANVISGNFITHAYGDELIFDMIEFAVDTNEALSDETYSAERAVSYLGDDEPIEVTFDIDS